MGYRNLKSLSVFISLVLRHKPEAAGISLDEHGWADIEKLLAGMNASGHRIDREMLEEIVRTDEKGQMCIRDRRRPAHCQRIWPVPLH